MVDSRALSVSKEEGVCELPRSAFNPGLNRPTLKMEKQRGAVNISIREDEAYSVVFWVIGKWGNNSC